MRIFLPATFPVTCGLARMCDGCIASTIAAQRFVPDAMPRRIATTTTSNRIENARMLSDFSRLFAMSFSARVGAAWQMRPQMPECCVARSVGSRLPSLLALRKYPQEAIYNLAPPVRAPGGVRTSDVLVFKR